MRPSVWLVQPHMLSKLLVAEVQVHVLSEHGAAVDVSGGAHAAGRIQVGLLPSASARVRAKSSSLHWLLLRQAEA